MLVDGYNVIYAWGLDTEDLSDARDELLRVLDDFAGFSGEDITVVFDGYRTKSPASEAKYGLLTVVFTAFNVSADIHIQRIVKNSAERQKVVTADGLEQLSVAGSSAVRITPKELLVLIAEARAKHVALLDRSSLSKNELIQRLRLDALPRQE